jgi:hypothetical protein
MDLEYFLNNFNNVSFNPYIVLNDNNPLNVEVDEKDLVITDIHTPKAKEFLGKLQKDDFKKNEYTGYFIKATKNTTHKIQTCFLTSQKGFEQKVHNVIVLEEGAKVDIFTGCLSSLHVKDNKHIAITEIFVGKNASLTFNMIHSWGETSEVFPKTIAKVEDGGKYISNYIVWDPVKKIVTSPLAMLGKNAKAVMRSLVYMHKDTDLSVGGRIQLNGKGSSGEVLSNIVGEGGKMVNDTNIEANASNTKGHIECDALLLKDGIDFETIPRLKANVKDTRLSHEASIGKISKDELEYLMSKGFSEKKATEMVVNGFSNNSVEDMPEGVRVQFEKILEQGSSM